MKKATGVKTLLFWITLYQTDELGVQMDETVFHWLVFGHTSLRGREHYSKALIPSTKLLTALPTDLQ